jgi:hypothetical protein
MARQSQAAVLIHLLIPVGRQPGNAWYAGYLGTEAATPHRADPFYYQTLALICQSVTYDFIIQ